VVDNADDNGTYQNIYTCGGIPGSEDADTLWTFNPSASFAKRLWIGRHLDSYQNWVKNITRWMDEPDTSGNYESVALNAGPEMTASITNPEELSGPLHYFWRVKHQDDSGNPQTDTIIYYKLNSTIIESGLMNLDIDTATVKLFYLGELFFDPPEELRTLGSMVLTAGVRSGEAIALTLDMDFFQVIQGKLMSIDVVAGDFTLGVASATVPNYVDVFDKTARPDSSGSGYVGHTRGEAIHLAPNAMNTIYCFFAENGGAHVVADTVTITCYITPKWALV
jgi:hypothetical protein